MSEQLRHAGAALSNCAFNLAQRKPGEPLTEADIRALDESRRAWDAALSTHHAAPGAPQQEEAETCNRCGGTGHVDDGYLTHSEGGVPYSEPIKCIKDCSACNGAGKVATLAAATAPAGGVTDDERNARGEPFRAEDLKLPLPAMPQPFIESTETGYALHRAPELLRFGADCYRLALTTAARAAEPAVFGDEDHVLVPRGLLGAACSAIDKKRDGTKTLAELRRYTVGDLSASPTPPTGTSKEGSEKP